jgi:DNA-directed RNA polymerase specialized sigma24 family protein
MPKELLINQTDELIILLKKKDRKVFDRLYDLYSKALFGIISSACSDVKLAEDILQASFISIWEKIPDFDPSKQHLFGWMLTITRDLMSKMLRLNSVENSNIQKATNNVTNESNVLFLIYIKGYSLKEVAKTLGISEEATKIKLKSELDQQRDNRQNERP